MTPCLHKQANHQCGTKARYVHDQCRCDACRQANTDYERERARWLGEFPCAPHPFVDAEPARRHVLGLMAGGMGPKRVAEVSGISHGAVSKLLYGDYHGRDPSKRIRRETAETLLAVELDVADGAKVPSGEAKRIVRELVARGWAKAEIGRRITGPHARALQAVESQTVMAGTLRILRGLLVEKVPLRRHPSGSLYEVKTGHEWRHIRPSTLGVPSDESVLVEAKGVLTCEGCGRPLVDHSMLERCA